MDGNQNHTLRAVPLSPVNRSGIIDIESSLSSSENAFTRSGSVRAESLEQDTGDSRASAGVFKVYCLLLKFYYVSKNILLNLSNGI